MRTSDATEMQEIVLTRLFDRYAEEQGIEVTDAEIDAFVENMQRGMRDEGLTAEDDLTPEEAADVYQGLDQDNPDLSIQRVSASDFVGVQPGVGDSINRYHGLDDGDADLFKADQSSSLTDSGDATDIYMGIAGNPDLHF